MKLASRLEQQFLGFDKVSQEKSVLPWVSMRFPREMWRQALGTTLGGRRSGSLLKDYHHFLLLPTVTLLVEVCKSWSQILLAHLGFLDRPGGIGGIHIVHLSCLCVRGQATGLICWVGVSRRSTLAGTSIVTWHSSAHAQSSRRAASNNKQTNISRYTNSTIEGGGWEKRE